MIYQRFETQVNALNYYRINRFIKPLEEMSPAVLSDDESDHEQGTRHGQSRYFIVNEAWRSEELVIWLRTMDLLACGEKWSGRHVARQGNTRRLRRHSSRTKDGTAVSGLPENCYDSEWLHSLKRYQREELDVQPPVDLTFSEEEKRCALLHSTHMFMCLTAAICYSLAAQFIPLANGDTRPTSGEAVDTSVLKNWLIDGSVESC